VSLNLCGNLLRYFSATVSVPSDGRLAYLRCCLGQLFWTETGSSVPPHAPCRLDCSFGGLLWRWKKWRGTKSPESEIAAGCQQRERTWKTRKRVVSRPCSARSSVPVLPRLSVPRRFPRAEVAAIGLGEGCYWERRHPCRRAVGASAPHRQGCRRSQCCAPTTSGCTGSVLVGCRLDFGIQWTLLVSPARGNFAPGRSSPSCRCRVSGGETRRVST
jgi:hypothetical protein